MEDTPTSEQLSVMPSTVQSIASKTVHSPTDVNTLVPTIALGTVPTEAVLLNKPKSWTPIQLFILKHDISNYLDKAFVEQLTHDLCHSYTIGYTGIIRIF